MAATSTIEWTEKTWNPVRGCSVISPGCHNCYAMKQAHRFSGPGKAYEGLTKLTDRSGPQWTGKIATIDHALLEPLSWRKPAKVFVNSMSDLFHDDVPEDFIAEVFGVMAVAGQKFQGRGDGYTINGHWTDSSGKQHPVKWPNQKHGPHTFQVLTKRPERMRRLLDGRLVSKIAAAAYRHAHNRTAAGVLSDAIENGSEWPLPNVWLGVSVENQKYADERIPHLLKTPAAIRFISAEPLLGPLDLWRYLEGREEHGTPFDGARTVGGCVGWTPPLDWVIVGGESGSGARPCHTDWIAELVNQCARYDVPCFVKQLGANGHQLPGGYPLKDLKGGDMSEWPADLRVRQFPEVSP